MKIKFRIYLILYYRDLIKNLNSYADFINYLNKT